jgi:hypothetical protein
MNLKYALTLVIVFASVLSGKDSGFTVSATDLPVLPGGVQRPYVVISEVTNYQTVQLEFLGGSGAPGSFYKSARKGMEVIREYAQKQGADAVIDMNVEFVTWGDGVAQANRPEGGIGMVFLYGTMIKYANPEAKKG